MKHTKVFGVNNSHMKTRLKRIERMLNGICRTLYNNRNQKHLSKCHRVIESAGRRAIETTLMVHELQAHVERKK